MEQNMGKACRPPVCAPIPCLTAPLASFAETESTKTDLPAVVELVEGTHGGAF